MKPLERIFFQACIMKSWSMNEEENMDIREIVNVFINLGFSAKQLRYYLEKWTNKGFYNYGVSLDLGWFETEKFDGEYKVMYESIKNNR